MTDVSVIIPTYNRLWCLPKAIDSCRNSLCTAEIIVVDDGSTDGTWEWLQSQQGIISVRQSKSGKCWAANKGFEISSGKYIRFLDSDDILNAHANDEQFELAERYKADVVVSGYQVFNDKGEKFKPQPWTETDDFLARQLGEGDGSHYSAFLFRKEFITDIPHRPDFAFRDDRLFILEAALKSPSIAVHQGTALLHRVDHNDRLQFSSGLKQQVQNYQNLHIYKKTLGILEAEGRLLERYKKAACPLLWHLAHWIAIKHLPEANEVVKWVYELNPDFKIPNKGIVGKMYRTFGFYKTEKLLRYKRSFKLRT